MNANMSYLALGEKEREYTLVFGHSAPIVSLESSDYNTHAVWKTHTRTHTHSCKHAQALTVRLRSRWHRLSKPNSCLSFPWERWPCGALLCEESLKWLLTPVDSALTAGLQVPHAIITPYPAQSTCHKVVPVKKKQKGGGGGWRSISRPNLWRPQKKMSSNKNA